MSDNTLIKRVLDNHTIRIRQAESTIKFLLIVVFFLVIGLVYHVRREKDKQMKTSYFSSFYQFHVLSLVFSVPLALLYN